MLRSADLVERRLRQRGAQFEQTSDPLYVWSAWLEARQHGAAIPDWVVRALDGWAGNLADPSYEAMLQNDGEVPR